jgi:hypothetical protein
MKMSAALLVLILLFSSNLRIHATKDIQRANVTSRQLEIQNQLLMTDEMRDATGDIARLEELLEQERKNHSLDMTRLSNEKNELIAMTNDLIQKWDKQQEENMREMSRMDKINTELRENVTQLMDEISQERRESEQKLAQMRIRGEMMIEEARDEIRKEAAITRQAQLQEIARLMDRSATDMMLIEEGRVQVRQLSKLLENERRERVIEVARMVASHEKLVSEILRKETERREAIERNLIQWGTDLIEYIHDESSRQQEDAIRKLTEVIQFLSSMFKSEQ